MGKGLLIEEISSILATDCGSTTTKAILIEKIDGEFRLIHRGEAPTTVEAPYEDVTVGVRNAIRELEDLTGRTLLDDEGIITPREKDKGVDIYLSTSSAGGGLQMMVAGVVTSMTAESAQRAALGAGAIVMDVVAIDDQRLPHEKVRHIRELRPDMIVLSGGIDGGTIVHVVELAELIAAAEPKSRFGVNYNVPVIYAGNKNAQSHIKDLLSSKSDLRIIDNLRPVLEKENLGPTREEIHNLFMEHVMAQAPGYTKLMNWSNVDIMPTPGAVGLMVENVAKQFNYNVLGVDIGGATTDVFSVFGGVFNRTVSANLGMSYSICNVLLETGINNILRWISFDISEEDIRNRLRNKMIRPTTIPQTLKELMIEQAVAREALSLAFRHHKELATGLHGVMQKRDMGDIFEQKLTGKSLVNMMELDMIIGSGGVLSHAPRRIQSAIMMIDAFQVEGITKIAVDSIFMMPQLGILSKVHEKAATQVFDKDCLIRLGTCVAPVTLMNDKKNTDKILKYKLQLPAGGTIEGELAYGEIRLIPLQTGQVAKALLRPAKGYDVGAGVGQELIAELEGGEVGIILDGRGRPIKISENKTTKASHIYNWIEKLNMYPSENDSTKY